MCRAAHAGTWHTQGPAASRVRVERSDWPESNAGLKETVVRQIMDHRVGTEPISSAEPTDVFELEIILRM